MSDVTCGVTMRRNQLLVGRELEHARVWGARGEPETTLRRRGSPDGPAGSGSARSQLGYASVCASSQRHVWLNTFEQSAAEALFRRSDLDGNGHVDESEVSEMLRSMAEGPMSARQLQELFDECDEEGQGELDLPHFLRFLAIKRQREASDARARADAAPLDTVCEHEQQRMQQASSVQQLATAAGSFLGGFSWLRARRPPPPTGTSLFCLGEHSAVRARVHALVSSDLFDAAIIALIVVTSALLPIEQAAARKIPSGLEPDAYLNGATFDGSGALVSLYYFALVAVIAFAAETALRIVALSWRGYFADPWHFFDVAMVLIGLLTFHPAVVRLSAGLRALRPFLALRPFRLVPRLPGVRVVASAVVYSVPHVLVLLLLLAVVSLILGVIGVALFGGKFGRCVDQNGELITASLAQLLETTRDALGVALRQASARQLDAAGLRGDALDAAELRTDRAVCERIGTLAGALRSLGRPAPEVSWFLPLPNFDYVGEAMLALFQISTLENWPNIMYNAMDVTGFERQPVRDFQQRNLYWPALYFLLTVFICSYVLANLFVGVILQHFARFRGMHDGLLLLSAEQRAWVHTQAKMLKLRPRPLYDEPRHAVRNFCFRLVHKPAWARWRSLRALEPDGATRAAPANRRPFEAARYYGDVFERFVLACIVANTAISMTRHRGQPASFEHFLDRASYAFASVFALEAAIKLTALGKRYFRIGWNRFDFAIVVLGIGEALATSNGWLSSIPAGTLTSMRAARVVRVLRLTRGLSALRKVISTLYFSLHQLANVGLLLVLAIFAFAVIGVELLGTAPESGPYGGVSRRANFGDFPTAALTLFAAISGEYWADLMWDYRYFGQTGQLNGWSSEWAVAFWVVFMVSMGYMLLSVFVAVLLEAFEDVREQSLLPIGADAIKAFALEWSVWDRRCTHFIPVQSLGLLLSAIREPLVPAQVGRDRGKVSELVSALRVPVRGGRVHYVEVLLSLAERQYWDAAATLPDDAQLLIDRMAMQWLRLYPSLKGMQPVDGYSDEPETVQRILAEWDELRGKKLLRRARKEEARHADETRRAGAGASDAPPLDDDDGRKRVARESLVDMEEVAQDEEYAA